MPADITAVGGKVPSRAADGGGPPGYDLLDEVGRGGMGAVYRAWDRELDREVAVKLLRPDLPPGADIVSRFADEARITGQLQHPGIPPVYRVGTTPDGRPFLAMKLVHGKTLSALLAAGEPIDVPAVFEGIAQAVGYAHAHGVVHRDLKPSNVMVGAFGEVQVMDWGLAKVLAAGRPVGGREAPPVPGVSSARDSETVAGSVLGTPGYMAPEQAAGKLDNIDARTDVFGLGAVLCQMLTGRPPFDGPTPAVAQANAQAGFTAIAFKRLDGCGADPGLVALCKRCLAFAPGDRPGSGNAVAEAVAGLRRAADDRARQAERNRAAADERAAQAVRRRRVLAVAAGAVIGVLALGAAGTTAGLVRAETARRAAEAARRAEADQRTLAVDREAEAGEVVRFFEDKVIKAARPGDQLGGRGKDVSLREAVTAAVSSLDAEFTSRPRVEARLRRSLGVTFLTLGDVEAGAVQLEKAHNLYVELDGPEAATTLDCTNELGLCLGTLGRHAEAATLYERSAEVARRVFGADDPRSLSHSTNLAGSYHALGRRAEAIELLERVLTGQRKNLGPDHPETLKITANLANYYHAADRHNDALRTREAVLAALTRQKGPDHPDVLLATGNLANSYSAVGRRAEALKLREDVYAAQRRVLGPDHPHTLITTGNLALNYATVGRLNEALRLWQAEVAGRNRVFGPDHPTTRKVAAILAKAEAAARHRAEAAPPPRPAPRD